MLKPMCRFGILLCFLTLCVSSQQLFAADLLVKFDTQEQAEHYEFLTKRYRCLKCQNQNLADSPAGLAQDLRREIQGQVAAGKSTSDIDNYLVQRYGEFVLYKPRFIASNWFLWLGPFVLLFVALYAASKWVRRNAATQTEMESVNLEEAKRLLKD